jgi:16S rRNA processing protein RimM
MEFVAVAKVSGPVGLRGEVKVVLWTDSRERFESLRKVWIGKDIRNPREFDVESVRYQGHQVVLKFGGIGSRSAAEELRNALVMILAENVAPPAKGSFFIDDVVGLNVVTEEGKRVGVVRAVLRLPSNDLWQVDSGSRVVSIPAVKEFIRSVDLCTKTVVIHEVEGLLDL